jgi:hypothetical protein
MIHIKAECLKVKGKGVVKLTNGKTLLALYTRAI